MLGAAAAAVCGASREIILKDAAAAAKSKATPVLGVEEPSARVMCRVAVSGSLYQECEVLQR